MYVSKLHYFVMAQITTEFCVCVCVIARDILARDFDGLHSLLLLLYVFLVLFSDLLLISHKGFSDFLTG